MNNEQRIIIFSTQSTTSPLERVGVREKYIIPHYDIQGGWFDDENSKLGMFSNQAKSVA